VDHSNDLGNKFRIPVEVYAQTILHGADPDKQPIDQASNRAYSKISALLDSS